MVTDSEKILKIIGRFEKTLPKFPDGRINYSSSDTAPVISIFIKYKEKFLILKRSEKVQTYRGKWNTVAGYLDELRPIQEKVLEELREEVGVREDNVLSIHFGKSYKFTDKNINKTWIVNPVLVELKNPQIRLDWEHTEFKWVNKEEIANFDTVPKLKKGLENLQQIRS